LGSGGLADWARRRDNKSPDFRTACVRTLEPTCLLVGLVGIQRSRSMEIYVGGNVELTNLNAPRDVESLPSTFHPLEKRKN
jgi:hypothetical protein